MELYILREVFARIFGKGLEIDEKGGFLYFSVRIFLERFSRH